MRVHTPLTVRAFSIAAAAAIMLGFGLGGSSAEESTATAEQPIQTTATFGNWTVRCRPLADQGQPLCEMIQVVPARNQQGALANLAIGQVPGDDHVRLVVQLPTAVHLPADVTLRIGEDDVAKAEFQSCFSNFCLASAQLDGEAIERMKKAEAMAMLFKDRAKRDASITISLIGFTAAHAATFNAGS